MPSLRRLPSMHIHASHSGLFTERKKKTVQPSHARAAHRHAAKMNSDLVPLAEKRTASAQMRTSTRRTVEIPPAKEPPERMPPRSKHEPDAKTTPDSAQKRTRRRRDEQFRRVRSVRGQRAGALSAPAGAATREIDAMGCADPAMITYAHFDSEPEGSAPNATVSTKGRRYAGLCRVTSYHCRCQSCTSRCESSTARQF